MLLDILEDSHEIRRLCIVGRNCILSRNDDLECSVPQEKQIAEGKYDLTGESNLMVNSCYDANFWTCYQSIMCRRRGRNRNAAGKLSSKVILSFQGSWGSGRSESV